MRRRKRRRQVLWTILVLSVFLLLVLIVMLVSMLLHEQGTDIQMPDQEESMVQTEEQPEETQGAQTMPPDQEESVPDEPSSEAVRELRGYIIIGDSHTVVADGQGYGRYGSKVEDVVPGKTLFFVHTGLDPVMGTIEWLEGDGTDRMSAVIADHPDIAEWDIICMHGTSMVMMPDIVQRYIALYQQWIDETFSGCDVHIVSVPPLDEAEWVVRHPDMPARSNQDIIAFNDRLAQAFPGHFVDYYDWLAERPAFQDEIHYTGELYVEMFDEIISLTSG